MSVHNIFNAKLRRLENAIKSEGEKLSVFDKLSTQWYSRRWGEVNEIIAKCRMVNRQIREAVSINTKPNT